MSESHIGQTDQPSPEFVSLTQQLLEHLNDIPYMIAHQSSYLLSIPERQKSGSEFILRAIILKAIESLSPSYSASFRAPHERLYNLLQLHYVDGMTIVEAARDLSISVRQAYRDLRRGEESVAAVLWMRQQRFRSAQEPLIAEASTDSTEVTHPHIHETPVDVREMVRHALQAVEQLARKRAVSFSSQMPEYPVIVFGDAVVAQQLIVGCISRAIQVAKAGTLAVVVTNSDIGACISLSYKMSVGGQQQALDEMLQKLTKQLGWPTISHGINDNEVEIWINIPARGVVLLVIDDNASITDLFERFLVNHPVHFLRASAADVGLSMARQIRPDAIILDIMMPIIDGWQLLQTLRNDPLTNTIPVIVCSVVSDPELAYSLGATHVLNKPVSRDMLLAVLNQLNLI